MKTNQCNTWTLSFTRTPLTNAHLSRNGKHQIRSPCIHKDCILLSPGAIGFSMGNNLKICNFQESYLECHSTPWYNITRIGHYGHCLLKIATITITWLLPYPKNAVIFFIICHRKTTVVCIPMFSKTKNMIEYSNPILPITLQVKIQYGCHYKSHIITDIRMGCNQSRGESGFPCIPTLMTKFLKDFKLTPAISLEELCVSSE